MLGSFVCYPDRKLSRNSGRILSGRTETSRCTSIQVQRLARAQTLASFEPFTSVNKLFHPKASKITITFKNEPDRKSKSELLGIGFGYKFVLYQPSTNDSPTNGDARKNRVNIRLGCQVKEWLEFRQDHCERRYKYVSFGYTGRSEAFAQIRATGQTESANTPDRNHCGLSNKFYHPIGMRTSFI